jgi:hypothetical protein
LRLVTSEIGMEHGTKVMRRASEATWLRVRVPTIRQRCEAWIARVAIEHSRRASFSQHKPTYCIAELPPRSRYGLAHDTPRIARGVHTAERPRG